MPEADDLFEDLSARYGARMFVPGLAAEFGICEKTVWNQVSDGRFPVPTYLIGRRRAADTSKVAAYLGSLETSAGAVPAPPMRRSDRGQNRRAASRKKARSSVRTVSNAHPSQARGGGV